MQNDKPSPPPDNTQDDAALRKAAAVTGAAFGIPFDPLGLFKDAVPQGLKILYVAPSEPESELLRQVLIDAGFHVEFVSSAGAGAFGVLGSNVVYVQEADYEEARAFLEEYLNTKEGDTPADALEGNESGD